MIKDYTSFIKKHLGYKDEEMEIWLDNPRNYEAILKSTCPITEKRMLNNGSGGNIIL